MKTPEKLSNPPRATQLVIVRCPHTLPHSHTHPAWRGGGHRGRRPPRLPPGSLVLDFRFPPVLPLPRTLLHKRIKTKNLLRRRVTSRARGRAATRLRKQRATPERCAGQAGVGAPPAPPGPSAPGRTHTLIHTTGTLTHTPTVTDTGTLTHPAPSHTPSYSHTLVPTHGHSLSRRSHTQCVCTQIPHARAAPSTGYRGQTGPALGPHPAGCRAPLPPAG